MLLAAAMAIVADLIPSRCQPVLEDSIQFNSVNSSSGKMLTSNRVVGSYLSTKLVLEQEEE